MATKKLTRKELKQEDSFIKAVSDTVAFLRKYRERISLIALGAVVISVVIALVSFSIRHSNQLAATMLQEGWTALQEADSPRQQSPKEKETEADKAKAREEKVNKAIQSFEELLKEHGSSSSAEQALFLLGNSYYMKGDYTAASSQYQKFIDAHPRHELVTAATVAQAYCLEEQGKPGQALAIFEALIAQPQQFYSKQQLYLDAARTAESSGQAAKAAGFYKLYIKEFPDSPAAEKVGERLAELAPGEKNGAGPKA